MAEVVCFAPIADKNARILILGSMPGVASLEAGQYYAHPRNQFWPMISRCLGEDVFLPYSQRVSLLKDNGIAVWDVLQSCVRPGSLDSAIEAEVVNDFAGFFKEHPGIERILFNGGKAEDSFRKLVLPAIDTERFEFFLLPSTSPANASYSYESKWQAWRDVLLSA